VDGSSVPSLVTRLGLGLGENSRMVSATYRADDLDMARSGHGPYSYHRNATSVDVYSDSAMGTG
jgi:hypothetical protein